jgi:hypothetical protein
MKRKVQMVHDRPPAQGRTATAQASTESTGPGDGKGQSTAGKAGHAGAFVKAKRFLGSPPGSFGRPSLTKSQVHR